jgi:hypothetical protein
VLLQPIPGAAVGLVDHRPGLATSRTSPVRTQAPLNLGTVGWSGLPWSQAESVIPKAGR